MTQYIDKSAVMAEIERRLEAISNTSSNNDRQFAAIIGAQQYELISLVLFLDTLKAKEVDLKQKSFVKIDRKLLFEICDAILNHDGYSDVNDCPENDSECFWGKWDEGFTKKVENIRINS